MNKLLLISAMLCALAAVHAYKLDYLTEHEIIYRVNSDKKSTWTAGENARFNDKTLSDINKMMVSLPLKQNPNDYTHKFVSPNISSIPTEFDAYKKWPQCAHPVLNQEQCGSCWAFSASESLSDRWCIQGGDASLTFSAETAISCDQSDYGCNGGFLNNVWKFMQDHGLTTWACEPYTSGSGDSGTCLGTCKDGSVPKLYKAKSHYAVTDESELEAVLIENIQKEVLAHGPVQVAFTVYQDFMSYQSGVYQHKFGEELGGHAVLLTGWGTENGTPYWLIKNSWGPDWGAKGFFKILRGSNECNIEKQVEAGLADVN